MEQVVLRSCPATASPIRWLRRRSPRPPPSCML